MSMDSTLPDGQPIKRRNIGIAAVAATAVVLCTWVGLDLVHSTASTAIHKTNAYELGVDYEYGEGGHKQNYVLSDFWFKKAAEHGYVPAEYKIGRAYFYGNGVYQLWHDAAYWFKKAAKHGYLPAEFDLARVYKLPKGMHWMESAANANYVAAENYLARAYSKGKKLPKNESKAYYWWHRSAENGDPRGEYKTAEDEYEGRGTQQNSMKAIVWWKKLLHQTRYRPSSMWAFLSHDIGSGPYAQLRHDARSNIKAIEHVNSSGINF